MYVILEQLSIRVIWHNLSDFNTFGAQTACIQICIGVVYTFPVHALSNGDGESVSTTTAPLPIK